MGKFALEVSPPASAFSTELEPAQIAAVVRLLLGLANSGPLKYSSPGVVADKNGESNDSPGCTYLELPEFPCKEFKACRLDMSVLILSACGKLLPLDEDLDLCKNWNSSESEVQGLWTILYGRLVELIEPLCEVGGVMW